MHTVDHTYNPFTRETEAGGLLQVPGKPGYMETLSNKQQQQNPSGMALVISLLN